MDDLVLVAHSKAQADEWRSRIETRLAERRLHPHPRKTQVSPARNGVPFPGFTVHAHYQRIRRANLRWFTVRLRRQVREVSAATKTMTEVRNSLAAWLGNADPARHQRLLNRMLRGGPWYNNGFRLASTGDARVGAGIGHAE